LGATPKANRAPHKAHVPPLALVPATPVIVPMIAAKLLLQA
jgi:hypothetical protein